MFNEKLCGKGYDTNGNLIYILNKGKGFIKEYNYRNSLIFFEGENISKKDLRGILKGKEYDNKGKLLFEGEFYDENYWKGKFKKYIDDALVFEGEYRRIFKWYKVERKRKRI